MEKHNCYICEKFTKFYEPGEDPYAFDDTKIRPDDVAGYGISPTIHHYKTGLFSKESIFICEGCCDLVDEAYGITIGDPSTYWKKSNTMYDYTLISGAKDFIDKNKADGTFEKAIKKLEQERQDRKKEIVENIENEVKRKKSLIDSIINLLKEKAVKMPASDIDAFLKHQDVDEIKELCEQMYHNSEISRTANYRYFILTEDKKKPKKASAPKSEEVDVEKELEKFKGMLDKGLINQEDYDAKKKELLGL